MHGLGKGTIKCLVNAVLTNNCIIYDSFIHWIRYCHYQCTSNIIQYLRVEHSYEKDWV